MEATLKLGNFQELTHDELMLVDGGSGWQAAQAFIGTLGIAFGVVVSALPGGQLPGMIIVGSGMHMLGTAIR